MLYLACDGVKGGSTLVRPGRGFLQFSLSKVLLERDQVKIAWNPLALKFASGRSATVGSCDCHRRRPQRHMFVMRQRLCPLAHGTRKRIRLTNRFRSTFIIPSERPSLRVLCKSQTQRPAPRRRRCAPTTPLPSRFPGAGTRHRSAAAGAPRLAGLVAAIGPARTDRKGRAWDTGWPRRLVVRTAP